MGVISGKSTENKKRSGTGGVVLAATILLLVVSILAVQIDTAETGEEQPAPAKKAEPAPAKKPEPAPIAEPEPETPKAPRFRAEEEPAWDVCMQLNRHFLAGMRTIVLDRDRKQWPATVEFEAEDHVEAACKLARAWGVGLFNNKPVRHFWISTKALPLLGYQKVAGAEHLWLVLSGNREKMVLTLTRLRDRQDPKQPRPCSLHIDQAPRAGTMGLYENGSRYHVSSSMAEFPTPKGEGITISGSLRSRGNSIPFTFEKVVISEQAPVWNETAPELTPRKYTEEEVF